MAPSTRLDGVLLGGEGRVRELTLNEPDRRNPMSPAIMSGIVKACDRLESDDEASVVIVTGAGRVFCAGGDLRYNDQNLGHGPDSDQRFLSGLYEPFLRILDLPMPTIAAINGAAIGGGLALSLLCDLRVASSDATLRSAFSSIGFSPGMGLTYTLPRQVGPAMAAEILYADRTLTGAEAADLGLVNRAVPLAGLMDEARTLASVVAANSASTNRLIKELMTDRSRTELRAQLALEIRAQVASASSEGYRLRRAQVQAGGEQ